MKISINSSHNKDIILLVTEAPPIPLLYTLAPLPCSPPPCIESNASDLTVEAAFFFFSLGLTQCSFGLLFHRRFLCVRELVIVLTTRQQLLQEEVDSNSCPPAPGSQWHHTLCVPSAWYPPLSTPQLPPPHTHAHTHLHVIESQCC